jgi:exopolyphosphatase/guanosine-5'-triphosphate,3'-diphosphate pyrophosphatase
MPAPHRIATIDVGTNTAQFLVADVHGGFLKSVHEDTRYVRLGQGVDANRRLAPEAVERVLAALTDFKATADELGAATVVIGATSASRDAQNLDELKARVRDLGMDYEVISGDEEALWTFRAACSAYPELDEVCVLDIGGGSTEVVTGRADAGEPERVSVDVGSVRLTERCFPTLPPSDYAVGLADEVVAEAFDELDVDESLPLLGSSGTVRVLGALVPGAPNDPIDAATVHAWREKLCSLSAADVLALNPDLLAGRADVYAAGVLVLDAFMQRFGFAAIRPSPRGLRHGLALWWMEGERVKDEA